MIPKRKFPWGYALSAFLLMLFSLGPILWCFLLSITPEREMLSQTAGFFPTTFTLENYRALLSSSEAGSSIRLGLWNTLKIGLLTVATGLPLSVLAGYALARGKFFGRHAIISFILLTIVIPVFSTLIPIYATFLKLNWIDRMGAVTLVYLSSFMPLNIWILMNYFQAMPEELWQAAELDGFSGWGTFWHVILPLSRPILMTSGLIFFLMAWKQYTIPVILFSSYQHRMITMVMSEFMSRDAIRYGMVAAGGMVAVLVPALVAVLFKKFLVRGLTSGTIKG